MPRTKAVLPAPRSPCRTTNVPGCSDAAIFLPSANVSVSEFVVTISGLAIGRLDTAPRCELEYGVSEVGRKVTGRHRHFPFVGFSQVAGERVEIDRNLARRFRIEQLREPC